MDFFDDIFRLTNIQRTSIREPTPESAVDALRIIRSTMRNNSGRSSSAGFSTVSNSIRAATATSNSAVPTSTSRSSVSISAGPAATKKVIPIYFARPNNDVKSRKVLDDTVPKITVNKRDQKRTEPSKRTVGGVTTFDSLNKDLIHFFSSDEETPRAIPKVNTAPQQLRLANSNATTGVKSVPNNRVDNKGTVKKNATYGFLDSSSSDEDDFGNKTVRTRNNLKVHPTLTLASCSKTTADTNTGNKVDYKALPNFLNDSMFSNYNTGNRRMAKAIPKTQSGQNTAPESSKANNTLKVNPKINVTKTNNAIFHMHKSDDPKVFLRKMFGNNREPRNQNENTTKKAEQPFVNLKKEDYLPKERNAAFNSPNRPENNDRSVPFGKDREPRNQNENTTKKGNRPFVIPTKDVNLPTGKIFALTLPARRRCSCTKLSETKYIPIKPDNEEYQIIVDEINNTIRKHVSGSYTTCDVQSIKKIKNCCLWMRFMNRQTDIKKEHEEVKEVMLFHGSMACDEICKSGFDERHSNQGGMFGAGVYFAKHSSKSNQYVFGYMGANGCPLHKSSTCTTCLRKMLLCRVELGNSKKLTSANKMSHAPPGFHSVSGVPSPGGLLYDEFVIYRGDQAYPEYEITYTIK